MTAQHIQLQIIPVQGNTIGAANVLVVPHGLSIPSTLYTDATLTTTLANPLPVDSTGNIDFWVADGSTTYDGFVSGGYVKSQVQITDLATAVSPYAIDCYIPKYFTIDLVPQDGGVIGEYLASVVVHGTTTKLPLFSDQALTSPISNPIVGSGNNIAFYVADSTFDYDILVNSDTLTGQVTIQNIWSLPAPVWIDKATLWQNEEHVWAWVNPYPVKTKIIQNVGQMYTANDIIRASMRLIQVSAVDTDLTASELQDGLESLNRMLDSWSADELTLYQVIRETFNLAVGQNPYSMGYGGDFNTSRPMKIVDAYLTLNNGSIPVSYPMQVLGYDDYNAIRLKTLQTNFPNYIYWQPSFPLSEVYIYPVFAPNDPATQGPATITLTSWKPFDCIYDATAYMSFPPGYWEAITMNLATRLALEYQFDLRPDIIQLAANALKRIKRLNQRTPTLQTDVTLMNTSQLRYNIYSDGWGR